MKLFVATNLPIKRRGKTPLTGIAPPVDWTLFGISSDSLICVVPTRDLASSRLVKATQPAGAVSL